MPRHSPPAVLLVPLLAALGACGGDAAPRQAALQPFQAAPTRASPEVPALLSAFHGLDALPAPALRLCDREAVGQDGMPVVFSLPLDEATVTAAAFQVTTAAGPVTPVCATLRPAVEPWEGHTVLLAGPFGTPDQPPTAVEVVDELRTVGGASARGLRTADLTALAAGPGLVLAEALDPAAAELAGERPAGTRQIVRGLARRGDRPRPRGAGAGAAGGGPPPPRGGRGGAAHRPRRRRPRQLRADLHRPGRRGGGGVGRGGALPRPGRRPQPGGRAGPGAPLHLRGPQGQGRAAPERPTAQRCR